jgi:hypothetical protein
MQGQSCMKGSLETAAILYYLWQKGFNFFSQTPAVFRTLQSPSRMRSFRIVVLHMPPQVCFAPRPAPCCPRFRTLSS